MMLLFEQTRDQLLEAIRRVRPVHLTLIGIVGVALLISIGDGELIPIAIVLGLAIALALLWAREFLLLMQAPDAAFPGRLDKLIWALALLLLPPIGLPAFWAFRKAHWPEAASRAKPRPGPWPHDGY